MEELINRIVEKMEVRGHRELTREVYVRCVRRYATYHGRCPTQMGTEEIEAFLLHLTRERRLTASSRNVYAGALRFLYTVVLGRLEIGYKVARATAPRRLPSVLTQREAARLLGAFGSLRHQAVAMLCYGAGLRVSEALGLEVGDIDSHRRVVRIRSGKGNKDREVALGHRLLAALRDYWRAWRPAGPTLFPSYGKRGRLTRMAFYKALRKSARAARIRRRVTPHTLRHSYATHLIEAGVDLRSVQLLLGHASMRSTASYVHLTHARMHKIRSPLDGLEGIGNPIGR